MKEYNALWVVIVFAGQALFTLRFLVQWIASERQRRIFAATAFWYFSIGGEAILLAYAIDKILVFICGQARDWWSTLGNIYFIYSNRRGVGGAGS